MKIVIPDRKWYKKRSKKENVPARCKFAHIRRCPKFFETMQEVIRVGSLAEIDQAEIIEVKKYWEENKNNIMKITNKNAAISGPVIRGELRPSGFSNLCPEVSYMVFRYYASILWKYADEIDKEVACQRAAEEKRKDNDWRVDFSLVEALHYLDCEYYDQLEGFSPERKENNKIEYTSHFIDEERIQKLKNITNSELDFSILVKICEELNEANKSGSYLTLAMLSRALVDHIPPVFEQKTFSNVVNNVSFSRSVKKSLVHLQESMRPISDNKLHQVISKKSIPPTKVQVNFSQELDVLLVEIISKYN